ncbi:lytic transglycosylase domain-containing protein [Methylomarinum sp. Ch1-1]|uniref:Lytic transglycosylase domain-containing protein n=1 Tax=Methylomarinum roseum TaxID=3067653 RepID=A0AAU7NS34_9GAMM|nr:lytic transglycosylase domain-containing protein [Methylomarinum sp. Ch1-1]MDP4520246.1 lytic transglycosylase domain-containing protein [Methylomarinum sp. Ch1-1]
MNRCVLALFVLFISTPATADVYKYTAPDGSVYYTDEPKKGFDYKRIIRTRPRNYAKAIKYLKRNKIKYTPLIAKAASKYQIDEKLLHAVIQTESAYDANAVSSAGAVGLMQLMPETAKRYGVSNRKDARQNIEGGTRYLKDLLKMFNSNLKLAVASYNAGEGAVKKYHNAIPPYPETQNYVRQVLALYRK